MGRFLEFFAGRIANAKTRAAYGRAVGQFLAWCEARGLRLDAVSPLHVAAYIPDSPRIGPDREAAPAAAKALLMASDGVANSRIATTLDAPLPPTRCPPPGDHVPGRVFIRRRRLGHHD